MVSPAASNTSTAMMSFIVPAHNEEVCLGRTLPAIHESARLAGRPYEILVVDDASTDGTAKVAAKHGAIVVPVRHRQIAATRNSGGRAARGERLFFVDADTLINVGVVTSALRAMEKGAVGGGAPAWIAASEVVPLYMRLLALFAVIVPKLIGFTGGAFMFCTREAFHASGGFDERLFWAEEGSFAIALKRRGRFVVLWGRVLTSGRRARKVSGLHMLAGGIRLAFSPIKVFTQRASVEKVWYDSDRSDDNIMPNSIGARISNGITFVIVLVMLSGPVWNFIPWSVTPMGTALGGLRIVIATFLCHVALAFWPVGTLLVVQVIRQKPGVEWLKLAALAGVCFWIAADATKGVVWLWTLFCNWLR